MTMSRPSSASSRPSSASTSPHPVLPPIITSEQDRQFLLNLNSYIDQELSNVDSSSPEQRYTVYKSAFDMIVDYVTAYKPLLTAIKAEYEDTVDALQRGQREAFYLAGKVKAMTSEPSTIRNYRRRADELEQKMAIIRADNESKSERLKQMQQARERQEQQAAETVETPEHVKKDNRPIPGLSVEQSTNLKVLSHELEKLERQYKELTIAHRTRYAPKDIKEKLKEQLAHKVALRDQLSEQTEVMKVKRHKLKIAVEAAHAYLRIQPPHQTIGDAVVMALTRASHQANDKGEDMLLRGTPSTTFEDDDPTREKEAEMMLEYIEKFNELMEDQKYEDAAVHAANSPKGILRTPETMQRFKELNDIKTNRQRSPLLAFADALMATVPAHGVKPNEYMSAECVRCALVENRLDLLSHWIAQNRLTLTEIIGSMLFDYWKRRSKSSQQPLALAQRVYMFLGMYPKVVLCMAHQGRIIQALELAHQKAKFTQEDYVSLLRSCPSSQLAQALHEVKVDDQDLLPLGQIVRTLLQTESYDIGLNLLQDIYMKGPHESVQSSNLQGSSPLRQAVFSDDQTSISDWQEVVQHLQDHGYQEAGLELLAAITVLETIRQASMHLPSEASAEDLQAEVNLNKVPGEEQSPEEVMAARLLQQVMTEALAIVAAEQNRQQTYEKPYI